MAKNKKNTAEEVASQAEKTTDAVEEKAPQVEETSEKDAVEEKAPQVEEASEKDPADEKAPQAEETSEKDPAEEKARELMIQLAVKKIYRTDNGYFFTDAEQAKDYADGAGLKIKKFTL